MKKLLVAFAFLIGGIVYAQQKTPTAIFETETHDFGKIREVDGPAIYKFAFHNTGGEPLIINNVQTSCGCTSPSYSKEPVLPGATGYITISYNTQNRPGSFVKNITVTTNGDPETIVLKISGEVIPKPPSVDDTYHINISGLKLKLNTNQIVFTSIYFGQKQTQKIDVINSTDQPLTIEFTGVPKHIAVSVIPSTLKPKEKGVMEISYDTKIKDGWGYVTDMIGVTVNGKLSPSDRLNVSANIQEDFSAWSDEQKKNPPKIQFSETTFDFESIKAGEKVNHEFVFKNTGNSDLLIHKTISKCGCMTATPKSQIIKPGETSSISVIFNSINVRGKQAKNISVISNDPSNPIVNLWIKGIVLNPDQSVEEQHGVNLTPPGNKK